MASGFLALNKDRKVLISSDTKNLFYNKMATYNGVIATSTSGGPSVRLSYIVQTSKQPIPFFTHPYSTYTKSITAYFQPYSEEVIIEHLFRDDEIITEYGFQIVLNDLSGVSVNQIITFDTSNQLVTAETQYWITSINSNMITISKSRGGEELGALGSIHYTGLYSTKTALISSAPVYLSTTRVTFISGTTWEIELLAGTTDVTIVPVVHIFTEYESTMQRNGSYGMLIKSNDGGVSFDTRLNPLAITATRNVKPPDNPFGKTESDITALLSSALLEENAKISPPGFTNGLLTPDLGSTFLLSTTVPASPIYFYMSIAQTYKQFNSYKQQNYSYGSWLFLGLTRNYVYVHSYCYYQIFCRAGISPRITSTNVSVSVGWINVSIATGGPKEGEGDYTRDVHDGDYLKGNNDTVRSDNAAIGGYTSTTNNVAIGTWAAAQTTNVKDQVVILADISRNI